MLIGLAREVTPVRSAILVGVFVLVLVTCGAGSENAPLDGAVVRDGRIVLISGCYESVDADTRLAGDQVVVTRLRGHNEEFGDCGNGVRLPYRAGLDVVYPNQEVRLAYLGSQYRRIDYCGVVTRRCVPVPTGPIISDCTRASLRFATIGVFDGVYPFEILRCERRWAVVVIDTCGGYHGEDAEFCAGAPRRVLFQLDADGRWWTTGIDYRFRCSNATKFVPRDLPKWVCKV